MRAFIALPLALQIKTYLGSLVGKLRQPKDNLSWVKSDNLHVTVRFLGETDERQIALLKHLLDRVASETERTSLTLGQLGGFPRLERARVIWIGLTGNLAPLDALARKVEMGVRELGFDPENRPFKAHVTLARNKGDWLPKQLIDSVRDLHVEQKQVIAESLVLFESKLSSGGSKYTHLHVSTFLQK